MYLPLVDLLPERAIWRLEGGNRAEDRDAGRGSCGVHSLNALLVL